MTGYYDYSQELSGCVSAGNFLIMSIIMNLKKACNLSKLVYNEIVSGEQPGHASME
jgi:hypothetical protein